MKSKTKIQPEILSAPVFVSFETSQARYERQARLSLQPREQQAFPTAIMIQRDVQHQEKRKSIYFFLFGMSTFAFLVLVFQDISLFFQSSCVPKTYFVMGSLIGITLVMLGTSIYFVSWKQMFFLYCLLDTVLISWCVSMIGLIGMLNVFQPRDPFFAETIKILGPISSFCTAGAYRILIKHANFNRWQNIIFKISIMADGMCYFMIGVYTMYTDHKVSRGQIPGMDSLFKDFHLLFVFGGLVFFKQLVNLHNRFDRTGKLSHKYNLIDHIEEDIEINMDTVTVDHKNDTQSQIQQNNEQKKVGKEYPLVSANSNQLQGQFQNKMSLEKQNIDQQLKKLSKILNLKYRFKAKNMPSLQIKETQSLELKQKGTQDLGQVQEINDNKS